MQDYHTSLTANISPNEAFQKITRVSEWWATNFEGSSQNLNDIFTVRFGEILITFQVVEIAPDKKIIWQVNDCYLSWLADKKEWNGTKIVWEVSSQKDTTQIDMTHVGLVPEIECYDDCKIAWDKYASVSLLKFLTEGKGLPDNF